MKTTIRCNAPANTQITRDQHGVPNIEVSGPNAMEDLHWSMGYCQAMDRGLQMLLMRILVQGRASECLDASDEILDVDKFFRKMNWTGDVDGQVEQLDAETLKLCQRFCDGINDRFKEKYPWEFKLVGYKPEPWIPGNILAISRMIGFISMAQSQGEIERLFIEFVQAGISNEKLRALFSNIPEIQSDEWPRDLLEKVELNERLVPTSVRWLKGTPRMMASNNWAVHPSKSETGHAILANDPHLEVNRLPNVWWEFAVKFSDRDQYFMGVGMPGLPAPLVGRNKNLAWSATYTFLDGMDSWVDQCKEGKFRRNEKDWEPFQVRKETILRKKKESTQVTFYENQHGTLDGDPTGPEPRYLLATRWASSNTGAQSINTVRHMWDASTVEEGMKHMGQLETSFNWVMADRAGNIGYQMSGKMPVRKEGWSGFIPLAGWDPDNDWKGFVEPEKLPRCINPESGFIVTANQDLNYLGQLDGASLPINAPMSDYRAKRIEENLQKNTPVNIETCRKTQLDDYSLQAEAFMKILGPLLPDTEEARLLKNWDLRYSNGSRAPTLFENFYWALYDEVFGKGGMGSDAVHHITQETGAFIDFFKNFDNVLLSENSPWFEGRSRQEIFLAAFDKATQAPKIKTWEQTNTISMDNIFFAGKLPKFLGFDRGPIPLAGGRATPNQGQIYRSGNRQTSFAPSFRMITSMGEDTIHTNIAGGPSDRRFSKWYTSDLDNWVKGRLKVRRL